MDLQVTTQLYNGHLLNPTPTHMPTFKKITHKLTTQYKSAQFRWFNDINTDKQADNQPKCTYSERRYDILLPAFISSNCANKILN